jgi:hypothetical protein
MHRPMALSLSVVLLLVAGSVRAQQPAAGAGISLSASGAGSGSGKDVKASTQAAATPPAVAAPASTAKVAAPAAPAASAAPSLAASAAATTAPAVASQSQPSATPAAAGETAMDAGTYSVRLRDLEQNVNELKEQIFRSKARLSLLAETVLEGVVSGALAHVIHENKMGNSYRLVKIVYALDGAPILNKQDEEGGLGDQESFDVYNGSMVPGEHTLTVQLEYRGHGYGIFSYLKGYRFKVTSSHTFTAAEGKATTLRVVGYEKGGPTAPLEERPAVRYVERVDAPSAPAQAVEGGE